MSLNSKEHLNVNISASRVGAYYDHACPRFTAYNILANPEQVGWHKRKIEHTALQDSGKIWEWEALKILQDTGLPFFALDKDGNRVEDVEKVTDKINGFSDLSEEMTINIFSDPGKYLEDLKTGGTGYIYQATIKAPDSFVKNILLKNEDHRDLLTGMLDDSDKTIHANWSICKPDLIRVDIGEDGIPVYSVIDMKHAKRARMSHKVQIAIYVKLIETLFSDNKINGRVNNEAGYLWNFKKAEPKRFDLDVVMPFMHRYFDRILPETLKQIKDCYEDGSDDIFNSTFTAMPTQMCEWCDNFEYCIKWQEEHEPVTLMPYLTSYAQEYLRRMDIPLSIDGFRKYVSEEANRKKLSEDCYSLKKLLINDEQNLSALEKKLLQNKEDHDITAEIKEQSSLAMPAWQDVCLILTVQRDEALDRMYALGLRASVQKEGIDPLGMGFRDTTDGRRYALDLERVFIAKTRDDIDACTRQFMECLYEVLNKCSAYNVSTKEDRDRISVQGYVMDNYELINFEETLLDELLNGAGATDEEYRDKLLAILYWQQGESMVTEVDEQAKDLGIDFPLIVITAAVKRLFSIPSYIAYDLGTVSDALIKEDAYKKLEKYSHALSNTMKSDPINKLWDSGTTNDDDFKGIKTHISIRLSTENRIVREMQKKLGGQLRRRPEPFVLRSCNSGMDVRAAKLWTEYQYEELLKYHDMRSIRMNDLSQMADDGIIMRVSLVEENPISKDTYPGSAAGFKCRYRLENSDSYYNGEMFLGLLLQAGNEKAEDELAGLSKSAEGGKYLPQTIMFPDSQNAIAWIYGIDKIHLKTGNDGVTYVEFERFKGRESEEAAFSGGSEFYIVEQYKNLQGKKVEEALKNDSTISAGRNADGGRTYLYPEKWIKKMDDAAFLDDCLACKPYDKGYDFTASQKKAFKHLFENNLTLLLGPPGTGKTDFIARAVITLCKYYSTKQGLSISVLVAANSHPAINNILAKISEKLEGTEGEPELYKFDKWDDHDADAIDGVTLAKDFTRDSDEKRAGTIYSYSSRKPFVMGATCWQSYKSITKYNGSDFTPENEMFTGYDIVVIDEASQMLMSAALISMQSSLDEPNTRFLIVGDEDQLPPVLQGQYDTSEQPVDFYGSVFRTYYDTAREYGLDYIVPLEEQFRMNEVLSRYPAESIYDVDIEAGGSRKGYHAYDFGSEDPKIATQKLKLKETSGDDLIKVIADPEYPLIVCRIHDGGALEKRDAEIDIATELVKYLRTNMIDPDTGVEYQTGEAGDKAFWGSSSGEGGMGIISPHHEQINRLRESIAVNTGMKRDDIFIGTVDKLQGRQREAVIVSYGVTDPEKAAGELEFIYSRNRLNVAMTRGKKKTVCILSDTLLDPSSELLSVDDDKILKGIDFMTGLLGFMQREEEDTRIDPFTGVMYRGVKVDVYRKRCI